MVGWLVLVIPAVIRLLLPDIEKDLFYTIGETLVDVKQAAP